MAVRRRLDAELVRRGLIDSRADATAAVEAGRVLVGGSPATTPARQVGADESISVLPPASRFVSRGGEKLAAALERFAVDVAGRRVLDAGASTGGFTDCVLQAGATHVDAVDVARGDLAWRLRTDPRVSVHERTNVRSLQPDDLGGPVDVVVADLSFISLRAVAPALARCSTPAATAVLLVKPQFEAPRESVGQGGVVRDPDVHRRVLRVVRDDLLDTHWVAVDVMTSPLRGADGNVEFFFCCTKRGVPVTNARLDECVDDAHARDSVAARR